MSDLPLPAADLLRSVGLVVDGPAAWGTRVRSSRPGVYVVELPGALRLGAHRLRRPSAAGSIACPT